MSFVDAGSKVLEGVAAGLYEGGTIIMAQSQVLVPVDTATLKRSGTVGEPVADADSISVTVGYGYGDEINPVSGEPAAGYAKWVELRTDVKHKPPTQARFLETPAAAFAPELPGVIEANVKQRRQA